MVDRAIDTEDAAEGPFRCVLTTRSQAHGLSF